MKEDKNIIEDELWNNSIHTSSTVQDSDSDVEYLLFTFLITKHVSQIHDDGNFITDRLKPMWIKSEKKETHITFIDFTVFGVFHIIHRC